MHDYCYPRRNLRSPDDPLSGRSPSCDGAARGLRHGQPCFPSRSAGFCLLVRRGLPGCIDLRRQLFPERDAYHLIGAPLEDLRWLDEVPRDRPALLIAEGVLHYLSEAEVKALLNAVVGHFPSGQMIFDVCHPSVVRRVGSKVGRTGATYKWGLDDPQDIKQLEPKLELIKEFRTRELVGFSRFPLWVRALFRAMEVNTALRRMERTVAYRYEDASSESRS